ncbi:MAG: DUF1592 domain-containing protein [Acidobacteriota bacterium]
MRFYRPALLAIVIACLAVAQPAPLTRPASASSLFTRYCLGCHNDKLKTGGLAIQVADLNRIPATAETWEKVVAKLESRSMPPAGAPRPDEATYGTMIRNLTTELDRAAAANPNPGKLPLLHRLTRTEYQNSIRDLLALNALPKENEISYLLPPDNVSSGFDNIADLLFMSPATMDRYLDAARKIARLAVGDPAMPVMVNIHRMDEEHPQDARVDELAFGTRGGLAIRSDFPVDGTYVVKVELAAQPRDLQELEITLDGQRVQLSRLGENTAGGRVGRGGPAAAPLEFRLPLKAGPKLIGIAFVQHSDVRDESTLRPRMRSRGTLPAIASATISGPYDVTAAGDSPSRGRIFICKPATPVQELPCARRILSALAKRAYRRNVAEADLQDLLPFYTAGRAEVNFDLGIQRALERLLVSPQFLFRIEHAPAVTGPIAPIELASRLSFFLWSSIPDAELLEAGISGRLANPLVLEQQTRRLLADPRSAAMVTNFAAQWLYVRDIDAKDPDEILFPEFDQTLRAAMKRETELFLDSVLGGNHSVLELLTANYSFLNDRLARHYGIPGIQGSYFRKVTFPPDSVRGGLLGQGSLLTITSYANRTSPVLRGKWVLENLLSAAPPPPPPDVPALKVESSEPGKLLSMRQAMTQHRANPVCASCHARMDPIGFSLENFDATGKWRDADDGGPIDSSGAFPGGTRFEGASGLKKELVRTPGPFYSTVAERLLMYAVGRNLQYYDAPSVRAIVRGAAPGNYTFASFVLGVVKSKPFRMREAPGKEIVR